MTTQQQATVDQALATMDDVENALRFNSSGYAYMVGRLIERDRATLRRHKRGGSWCHRCYHSLTPEYPCPDAWAVIDYWTGGA